jgi:hypothetical protein
MPEQRELPLKFPELSAEAPLIPVRMVNEFVYWLAYLDWVQGEFTHNADTVEVDPSQGRRQGRRRTARGSHGRRDHPRPIGCKSFQAVQREAVIV